jgi:hypothetical protein
MWNTRLFFLDDKKQVLLFCRDPSKKRIFWKDRSLKPRRIRTDSIVRVAMCDAPSDRGRQPVADAVFELDWRPHPDVPHKRITSESLSHPLDSRASSLAAKRVFTLVFPTQLPTSFPR